MIPPAPARRLVVVTCMDARLEPLRQLGLELGDAHVLRNAGAVVTDDVLRSLAVSSTFMGTRQALVVGHTGCGIETLETELLPYDDVEEAVRDGVRRILESPLLPDGFSASGRIYDVETGELREL
ncbi:MAG: carbonic anhydrase [Gaiellaceae bacterium]